MRGLKSSLARFLASPDNVAPYTGAWIEITSLETGEVNKVVAPYTGAWIEIVT